MRESFVICIGPFRLLLNPAWCVVWWVVASPVVNLKKVTSHQSSLSLSLFFAASKLSHMRITGSGGSGANIPIVPVTCAAIKSHSLERAKSIKNTKETNKILLMQGYIDAWFLCVPQILLYFITSCGNKYKKRER